MTYGCSPIYIKRTRWNILIDELGDNLRAHKSRSGLQMKKQSWRKCDKAFDELRASTLYMQRFLLISILRERHSSDPTAFPHYLRPEFAPRRQQKGGEC